MSHILRLVMFLLYLHPSLPTQREDRCLDELKNFQTSRGEFDLLEGPQVWYDLRIHTYSPFNDVFFW